MQRLWTHTHAHTHTHTHTCTHTHHTHTHTPCLHYAGRADMTAPRHKRRTAQRRGMGGGPSDPGLWEVKGEGSEGRCVTVYVQAKSTTRSR